MNLIVQLFCFDAESAISPKEGRKIIFLAFLAAYFWGKYMSNKNGRQFFYSFVGCAAVLW